MKQLKGCFIALPFMLILLDCISFRTAAQDTEKEKAVKAYYAGFQKHDWSSVAGQLTDDFTFTSPAGDDHISVERYKEKCWPTNKFFKSVTFVKMIEKGDDLILLVEINTTDDKVVRNIDLFSFNGSGKIRSHECFFGAGESYPGHSSDKK